MSLRSFGEKVLDLVAFILSVYFTGGWWLAVTPLPMAVGLTALWEIGKPVFSSYAAEWIAEVAPRRTLKAITGALAGAIALFFITGSFLQSVAGIKMQEAQERARVRATDPEIPALRATVEDLQTQIDSQLGVLAQYNAQGSHAPRTTAAIRELRDEQAATITRLKKLENIDGGNLTAYELLSDATGGKVSGSTFATTFGLLLAAVVEMVHILMRLLSALQRHQQAIYSPTHASTGATPTITSTPPPLHYTPPIVTTPNFEASQSQTGPKNITPALYSPLPEADDTEADEPTHRESPPPKRTRDPADNEIATLALKALDKGITGRDALTAYLKIGHTKASQVQDWMVVNGYAVRNNRGGIAIVAKPGLKIIK